MRLCSVGGVTAVAVFLASGCATVPSHDGYKNRRIKPWKKPTVVELLEEDDGYYEGEADSEVNYRKRKRARWFAVDLDNFGSLTVRLGVQPFEEDEDRQFDIAFEVLDANYNIIARADKQEDDAGDLRKKRELGELKAGRYYIHIFAQERIDKAEFTLKLAHRSKTAAYQSDFPAGVPYIGVLPQVPAFDDAPAVAKKPSPRRPRPRKPTVKEPAALRGRIAGIKSRPTGTTITINRGRRDGVSKGWRGTVVSARGRAVPNGGFTVSKVTQTQCYGTVRASQDTVTAAKYVRLRPP